MSLKVNGFTAARELLGISCLSLFVDAVGFVALAASVYMLVRLRLPEREGAEVSIPYRGMLRGVLKIRNVLIVVFIYIMVAIFFGFIEPLMPPYLLGDSACPEPRLDCFSA